MCARSCRSHLLLWACVVLAVCAPAPAFALDGTTTSHKYEACPEATSPEPGVIAVHLCRGPGDVPIKWFSEPDSSSIALGKAPIEEELGLGSFFEAAASIEWRGAGAGKRFTPMAAIATYAVGKGVSKLDGKRLVVHRLEPSGTSCIMAVLDGRGAQAAAKARQIADRHAPSFTCGKSRRMAL